MKYWEKTVEYAFLALAIKQGKADFAAPLSGKLERGAGDAMFAKDSCYILVEFKADASGMAAEKSKFLNYDIAKKALETKDHHHFFLYGEYVSEQLGLLSRTYFSETVPAADNGSAVGCFDSGVDKSTFDKYLREFLKYRRPDERGDSGVEVSDYATVIGVEPHSKFATACSLRDYANHYALGNVLSPATEPLAPKPLKFK